MPTDLRSLIALLAVSLAAAGISTGSAHAQDCLNWGDLDRTLYCDENRDLIADTPTEGYRLADPDTLVFSRAAADDLLPDEEALSGFIEHLAKRTGKKVRWAQVASSAEQIKAMRSGEAHLAVISPGPTVYAVNLAGYVPLVVMCNNDGDFEDAVDLITAPHSSLGGPDDLAGRKVARVSALSNTGALQASSYQSVYTGSESKSIIGTANGSYDAALIGSDVLVRGRIRGIAGASDAKVIWQSRPYPPASFGFAHNLSPDLQRRIHDAFLTYDWKGTALAKATGRLADKFCTISYQDAWQAVRLEQKENGVVYDIDHL